MVRCAFMFTDFDPANLPLMTAANAAKLSCKPLILFVGAPEGEHNAQFAKKTRETVEFYEQELAHFQMRRSRLEKPEIQL